MNYGAVTSIRLSFFNCSYYNSKFNSAYVLWQNDSKALPSRASVKPRSDVIPFAMEPTSSDESYRSPALMLMAATAVAKKARIEKKSIVGVRRWGAKSKNEGELYTAEGEMN